MFNNKNSYTYQIIFIFKNFLINDPFFQNYKFYNYKNLFKKTLLTFFWIKLRVAYYVNNWVYTTNHKRIAVNYFWFVILSGIVGMVLATLIRLEFAYPGVGIFAGDSLQYLSLATAHGVIMVFFMIMPLLFGAFANFLLPTQLGVHDVAFPRLNSAAFWFLPGGLLMLCQLVCVDRRYQRMNCFNIREIQSILKRKFFVDLVNSHDHHVLLDKTIMGLRYKTNTINTINSNMFVFYNYGLELGPKLRISYFNDNLSDNSILKFSDNSLNYYLINLLSNINIFEILHNFYLRAKLLLNFNTYFQFFKKILNNFVKYFLNMIDNFIDLLSFFFNNIFAQNTSNLNLNSFLIKFFKNLITLFSGILNFLLNNYLIFLKIKTSSINAFFNVYNNTNKPNFTATTPNTLNEFMGINFNIFNNNFYLDNVNNLFFSSKNVFLNFTKIYWINGSSLLNIDNKFSKFDFNKIYFTESLFHNSNLFKKSFFSELNYDSRMVYVYFFFYFLYNLPFLVISFFKNIFNLQTYVAISNNLYNFLVTWYFTFLVDNNLFELFIDKNNISFSSIFNNFLKINFFNFFNFIQDFLYLTMTNFTYVISVGINELVLNYSTSNFLVYLNNLYYSFSKFFFNSLTIRESFKLLEMGSWINNNTLTTSNTEKNFSYFSNYFSNTPSSVINKFSNEEFSEDYRYNRFSNPLFKYDYKAGNYFPKSSAEVFPFLFTTVNDITGKLRSSPWFLSNKYVEFFEGNFSDYLSNVQTTSLKNEIHSLPITKFSPTDGFYNFFYLLSNDVNILNKKHVSLDALNQKFYKMFSTSSMQQRVYSNWRQLKFTREAWRCKLLAARHQKTLFKRYFHEDGILWSIERNAKDLLPGWAMITPFSARTRFTAVGKTDIGLMGVLLVLNSSLISGANFLVTYRYLSTLNNRKMRDARAFFTEGIMVASWMMIAANPMLVIGIIMLLSDRHWQTSFFDYSGGGDTVLFQHMFWFFGHPEVYVIIIPTFGFTNTMLSFYLKKRVSARASLLYSMYTIAFLGFFVWGHHMYMVGLAHTTRMLFSTLTVMISVPAATKIMHWCVTTVNSSFATELPLLFIFTFIFFFVSGGISGMCVAHTGMDVLFHDTFYVIGHFHVMLAGAAMFGSFGAFYFYFPAIFGVKFSRIYAYLHYSYYLLGQLMTVIPMFWLGYAGMPRRVLDYPASLGGWHSVISAGHMLSVAGLMAFFIMIFDSLRQGRAVVRNTFGISRYNTRLNFYLYEIARLTYVQQKGLTLFKFNSPYSIKLNKLNYFNFEPYETTLLTYVFSK